MLYNCITSGTEVNRPRHVSKVVSGSVVLLYTYPLRLLLIFFVLLFLYFSQINCFFSNLATANVQQVDNAC